jgi:hypothetical protein
MRVLRPISGVQVLAQGSRLSKRGPESPGLQDEGRAAVNSRCCDSSAQCMRGDQPAAVIRVASSTRGRFPMRLIVLGVCLFAAACSGQVVDSPTSPSTAAVAPGQTHAQGPVQLPFRGTFTGESMGVLNCPPTCPPTILRVTGTDTGEATHLGHFSAVYEDEVDSATATGTGTFKRLRRPTETSCSRDMQADKPSSSHQMSRPSPWWPQSRAGRVGSPQPPGRLRSYASPSLISQPARALNPERSKGRSLEQMNDALRLPADSMPHG